MSVPENELKDFDEMFFKVHRAPEDEPLLESIPELREIQAFTLLSDRNADAILKYICYSYDKKSPLVYKYRKDLKKRQELARKYSGAPKYVFDYDKLDMAHLILSFCSYTYGSDWKSFVIYSQVAFDIEKNLVKMTSEEGNALNNIKTKLDIIKKQEEVEQKLARFEKRVFNNDSEIEKRAKMIPITPENAEAILNLYKYKTFSNFKSQQYIS